VTPLPAVEPTPVAPAAREYVVEKGDSFYSIGRKFGVSPTAISKANPGVDSTRLRIGQTLQIPAPPTAAAGSEAGNGSSLGPAVGAPEVYVVKSGDTLTRIATRHGTTVAALKALNNLATDRINVGQKLKIPVKAPATESAPAGTQPF
jgi:LysM repeat protein